MTSKELKQIRKKLGLTQSELAKILGYPNNDNGARNIRRLESGKQPSGIIQKCLEYYLEIQKLKKLLGDLKFRIV